MYEETLPLDPEMEIDTGFEPDPDSKRRSKEVSQLIEEGKLITIQNMDLWDQVLHEAAESKKLLVVDFTIPWDLQTPDRHKFESFLSELASEHTDIIFVKADIFNVTDLKSVAEKWGVTGTPTFKFFKNGIILDKELSGLDGMKVLKETVNLIASSDPKSLDPFVPSVTPTPIHFSESCNEDCWLDSGFRSRTKNEAYLFIYDTYMVVDYTNLDKLVEGPKLTCKGFKYLRDSDAFFDGVLCAFSSHDPNEAYLFTQSFFYLINYVEEKIIEMKAYNQMFPFLVKMNFLLPDAAFESSEKYEAYMFFEDQYVRINYKEHKLLEGPNKITDEGSLHFLSNTVFESGIEAAFTTHTTFDDGGRGNNLVEAYIFKEGNFAVIRFTPGSTEGGYIVGHEPKRLIPDWPALVNVVPFKNCFYEYTDSDDDYGVCEAFDIDDIDDINDDDDTDPMCTDYSSTSSDSSDNEAKYIRTPRCGVNNDLGRR